MKLLLSAIATALFFVPSALASPYKNEDPRMIRFAASAASAYCLFENGVMSREDAQRHHLNYVVNYGFTDEEIKAYTEDPLTTEMAQWSVAQRPC